MRNPSQRTTTERTTAERTTAERTTAERTTAHHTTAHRSTAQRTHRRTLARRGTRLAALLAVSLACVAGVLVGAPAAVAYTPTPTDTSNDTHALFNLINQERASYHLPAYRWSSQLNVAAHNHNIAMARANVLSHQVAGEASLGSRVTAAGYHWSALGENCAFGTNWTQDGVVAAQKYFFNETAPNDQHRQAVLSKTYVDVGINVLIDTTHHKFWLTEDFGKPL